MLIKMKKSDFVETIRHWSREDWENETSNKVNKRSSNKRKYKLRNGWPGVDHRNQILKCVFTRYT